MQSVVETRKNCKIPCTGGGNGSKYIHNEKYPHSVLQRDKENRLRVPLTSTGGKPLIMRPYSQGDADSS